MQTIILGIGALGLNLPALVAQLVSFTLLLIVFRAFLYKPVIRILDERKQRIQEGLDASDEAKRRLSQTEQEVAKELEKARQEGQGLIAQAQQISARIQEEARQGARQEAEQLLTRARGEIQLERDSAIADLRRVIAAQFGPDYLPSTARRYATRTKNAQEAHEAIRPVHPDRTPVGLRSSLSADEHRLYDLIWKRTLSSQMPPAQYHQRTALVTALWLVGPGGSGAERAQRARPPENPLGVSGSAASPTGRGQGPQQRFTLRATASTLTFPGWLKAYGEDTSSTQESDDDAPNDKLPDLKPTQTLYPEEVLPTQHFTQPPRRYTEPTLVKALEDAGVGRPSTYATVVSTIQDRDYVRLEQRHFLPTELGFAANDFLVTHFPKIVDLPFTAEMEDALDEIAGGRLAWTEMLQHFYGPFRQTVDAASGAPMSRPRREPAKLAPQAGACPDCGKPLVERRSQYGVFFGCSGYPTCRYIKRDPAQPKKPTRTRRRRPAGPPSPRTKHVIRGHSRSATKRKPL